MAKDKNTTTLVLLASTKVMEDGKVVWKLGGETVEVEAKTAKTLVEKGVAKDPSFTPIADSKANEAKDAKIAELEAKVAEFEAQIGDLTAPK